MTLTLLRWG